MEGQVRSVYLTLRFFSDDDAGVLLHEIQIDKEGIPLMNSTTEKPVRPERQLVDKTEITTFPFIRCERIGSQLYLFAGPHYQATAKVGYIFDAKSDGELVKFHDLPFISHTCPTIMAAHGRLYHLATPKNDRDGEPMPFEVYDHSTKSWDPLPPLPQCRVLPDPQSPSRMYSGYAVWGTCILVSLWYFEPKCFVPVLFDAKSRTWHHVDVAQQKLEEECFPWDDKAIVVGNTIYALGFEPGIISISIEKSGSEEDGTLMYSLTSPYKLEGLELHRDPHYPYFDRMFQCWAPLGDFEFCLVQTMDHPSPTFIPLFITTFKIIQKEGTSSRIETLRSSLQFMSTEDYGQFWPIFCYNPDNEPKEVMLTTSKEDTRNRIADISTSICYLIGMLSNYVSFRDSKPKEVSLTNRKENGQIEICGIKSSSCRVECSMPYFEPKESVMNSKQARRRHKRKVKQSKEKGSEGIKRNSYIVSLVKHQVSAVKLYGRGRTYVPVACFIIFFIGLLYGEVI